MMRDLAVTGLMAGAISTGFLVVSLYFIKFWLKTRDGLFVAFAVAFLLLAVGQGLLVLAQIPSENRSGLYLFRLVAFGLIIAAVLSKNMRRR